jgi:hypothetical protein
MAELMIKFTDHITSSSFEENVDKLPYWGRTTNIDLGLEVAFEEMFQEYNGMRSNASKTLVLLSDGRDTRVRFDLWREKLNTAGIRVLVIGVGNINKRDLRHMVNDDKDFYIAKDFNDLLSDEFMNSIILCGGKLLIIERFKNIIQQ